MDMGQHNTIHSINPNLVKYDNVDKVVSIKHNLTADRKAPF